MMQQPTELLRFISSIPVMSDGVVPMNTVETQITFNSPLYEATYSLSVIARMTQDVLTSGKIESVDAPVGAGTIVSQVLDSDLASYSPGIYLLIRMTVLESFALLYHLDRESENLQYVTSRDISRVRENINFINDYLGSEPKYHKMIEILRHMHISFGYLQNQVDVMMNSRGVR